MKPFDFVNSVSFNKKNLMEDASTEADYVPFLTNRSLSYHQDTIGLANMMNARPWLDNKLAYDFYLNSIRPRKRFSEWYKKDSNEDTEVVMEYYGCNQKRSSEIISILTPGELERIRKKVYKGE